MSKRVIRSNSFPQSFFRVFYHVATSGNSLTINNLPTNHKRAYVNLRARLNEYRKAFHNEALAAGNQHQIDLADSLYGVVCREPEEINGTWQLVLEHKHEQIGNVLDELVPDIELPASLASSAHPAKGPSEGPAEGPPLARPAENPPTTSKAPNPDSLPQGTGAASTKAIGELFHDEPKAE